MNKTPKYRFAFSIVLRRTSDVRYGTTAGSTMKLPIRSLLLFTLMFLVCSRTWGQNKETKQECNAFDPDHKNAPVCSLPLVYARSAEDGYVSAQGKWSPDGALTAKGADVEFTCVKAVVPQLSHSRFGFCLMATGYVIVDIAAVSTNYFDILSWSDSKITADRDGDCEIQQLVIDLPANTVTLTSDMVLTGACGKRFTETNELLKKHGKDPQKQSEAFSLVHTYGDMYANKDSNPFLRN